ncbi:MAG TPA: DUF1156 domain-containing protein [Chloroflexia bacterium]|nr:DUF1156 domain-containing protein [Chloroflexia bacterium]
MTTETGLTNRLIEHAMPLREVSAQSAREKSIRHGHISTLHIWWARRPLAACRAAVYAALLDDPATKEERDRLCQEVAELSNWDIVNGKDYKGLLETARARIRQRFPTPPRILDPFSGGGAIPLEALRLGCEAYANELNPVAYIVELCTLVYPQQYGKPGTIPHPTMGQLEVPNKLAEDVKRWANWVLQEARTELAEFYPPGPNGATPVAYLWARTVKCSNPACGTEIPLVRQTWLAKNRGIALEVVPDRVKRSVSFKIVTGVSNLADSDTAQDDGEGTTRAGGVTCPVCNQSSGADYIRTEGKAQRIGHMAMVVVELRSGEVKSYRVATQADQQLLEKARKRVATLTTENGFSVIPDEALPEKGTLGFRVQNYGVLNWGQLFNPRQGLALATFAAQVRRAYDLILAESGDPEYARAVTTYLALLVDRQADYNSVICNWHNTGEKVNHSFSRQAVPMVWDYTEINPFSSSSGSYEGAVEWILRVIEANSNLGEPAEHRLGSATRLPFEDGYFDAVVTDPPYYDAVPYADLSDFFYVWMRRTIGPLYPQVFRTPLTPKAAEIVQNPSRQGGNQPAKEFFEREMGKAFAESARVLKDDGIAVIVFAHKSTEAWETLINSLLSAGLYVTASWPINTEMGARLRAQDSAALASSFFIVCRKRLAGQDGYYDLVLPEMRQNIRERLAEFWEQGIRGPDFFISAIGPALQAFGRYRRVLLPNSGEEVPAAQFLKDVRGVVAEFALERILKLGHTGAIDELSRFYLFWRWSFGTSDTPIDEARKLAQALGIHLEELLGKSNGILRQKGDKARIRGVLDRKESEGLGLRGFAGGAPGMVDILHRACLEAESGGPAASAEYLAQAGKAESEEFWTYAQALGDILPDGDKEKNMIQVLNTLRGAIEKGAADYQQRQRPRPKPGEGQLIMLGFEEE